MTVVKFSQFSFLLLSMIGFKVTPLSRSFKDRAKKEEKIMMEEGEKY